MMYHNSVNASNKLTTNAWSNLELRMRIDIWALLTLVGNSSFHCPANLHLATYSLLPKIKRINPLLVMNVDLVSIQSEMHH